MQDQAAALDALAPAGLLSELRGEVVGLNVVDRLLSDNYISPARGKSS
jgi:hypothetical protein